MATGPTGHPSDAEAARLVCHDPGCLAPKFKDRVDRALATCHAKGLDAVVYETCRSNELAALYYALGRSRAKDAWHTWHHYGLAVDVISASRGWAIYPEWDGTTWRGGDPVWYEPVWAAFAAEGLHGGHAWIHFKDCPHWQWHVDDMRESPSPRARELYVAGGPAAVWAALGAQ